MKKTLNKISKTIIKDSIDRYYYCDHLMQGSACPKKYKQKDKLINHIFIHHSNCDCSSQYHRQHNKSSLKMKYNEVQQQSNKTQTTVELTAFTSSHCSKDPTVCSTNKCCSCCTCTDTCCQVIQHQHLQYQMTPKKFYPRKNELTICCHCCKDCYCTDEEVYNYFTSLDLTQQFKQVEIDGHNRKPCPHFGCSFYPTISGYSEHYNNYKIHHSGINIKECYGCQKLLDNNQKKTKRYLNSINLNQQQPHQFTKNHLIRN
ncbi:hypothetical protein DLAC_03019 [Tieghemostelium lacteum]|uniref:Uncharacterized protein n=1 Tax=Tieghemostelium lacteum TaxID=361077 RepID=A0A152A417_TIELA|nr:hypothetical protein DLAC_03019 [Tieghemostelium lacteum]|eukprot:KYR00954.1 hypothetical protein DLAC_03019 [Tieghemostelium lacteum]